MFEDLDMFAFSGLARGPVPFLCSKRNFDMFGLAGGPSPKVVCQSWCYLQCSEGHEKKSLETNLAGGNYPDPLKGQISTHFDLHDIIDSLSDDKPS